VSEEKNMRNKIFMTLIVVLETIIIIGGG